MADLKEGDFDYSLKWDGTDNNNNLVPKGVYIYQIECDGKVINGAIVVAR